MLIKRPKCFMIEEGGSPGGGAAPPAPVEPAAPTPAPTAPPSLDDIMSAVKATVANEFKSQSDGFFASARKAGLLKQPDPPPPAPQSKKSPESAPADPMAILALRDAFDDATSELKLTKGQRSLLREHVMRVQPSPDGVESMVSDYVSRAGWQVQSEAPKDPLSNPTPPNPAPTPSTHPPASDKGSPAPGGVVNWEAEFMRDPLRMSPAAKAAMAAKHGADKARSMRLEAIKQRADQIRVVVTP